MMKKVVTTLLALTMAASMLAGCSSGEAPAATEDAAAEDAAATEDAAAEETVQTEASGDLLVYGIYKAGDQTWFLDEGDAAKAAVEAEQAESSYT